MKRTFARSLFTASSLSLILLVNAIAVQAQKSTPSPRDVSVSPAAVNDSLRTGGREWTREEMLRAVPLDVVRNSALSPQGGSLVPTPTGARGGTAPGVGGAASSGIPRISTGVEELEREATAADGTPGFEVSPTVSAFSYPYPFTRYAAFTTDYTTFPYRAVGKVFFRQRKADGTIGSFVCSASSIGNYSVITAGHCVHSGNNNDNGWSSNFVFVPGYRNGVAPFGQFSADHLRVMNAWRQSRNFARDVGGAVLNKNTIGASTLKVSQRVGWLGTLWNASYFQHFHSLGYPASAPFSGQTLQICASSFARHDTSLVPNSYGIGCDATGGTSGGPVVVGLRASTGFTNRVNGVNSYKLLPAQPLALYSPYFDSSIGAMINCLINSSPTIERCSAPAAP
jgi:V8-like Glu-specific endopeptidase